MYGPSHWAVLAVFVFGAVLLVWAGRRQTEAQARRLGRFLGALTALIYAAVQPPRGHTRCGPNDIGRSRSRTTGVWC